MKNPPEPPQTPLLLTLKGYKTPQQRAQESAEGLMKIARDYWEKQLAGTKRLTLKAK